MNRKEIERRVEYIEKEFDFIQRHLFSINAQIAVLKEELIIEELSSHNTKNMKEE